MKTRTDQSSWKTRVDTSPDFVALPGCRYSLSRLLKKHSDAVPEETIAKALVMTPKELADVSEGIVVKIRKRMGVKNKEVLPD
jgi:hypothetical protein